MTRSTYRYRDARGLRLSINRKRETMTTIADRIRKVIAEHLDQTIETCTDGKTFSDLGADSLDSIEIVMALEEEFDTEIPDHEADGLSTVGEVIAYLTQKLEPAAA